MIPDAYLKLDGDSPDSGLLKTLHQVGDETGDLVPQRLGRDQGDLLNDLLVGVEVKGELGVVLLNDDLGGLLDGLGTDTTHLERVGSKKFELLSSEAKPEKEGFKANQNIFYLLCAALVSNIGNKS